MNPDDLPRFAVIPLRAHLRELSSFLLDDDRGYEEMVRQAFDYVSDATADNDLLHEERVPHLNAGMVYGLAATHRDEAQLAFATLYEGIRRELVRLGVDQLVAQGGQFPFVLDHIRPDRSVVLKRLSLRATVR